MDDWAAIFLGRVMCVQVSPTEDTIILTYTDGRRIIVSGDDLEIAEDGVPEC